MFNKLLDLLRYDYRIRFFLKPYKDLKKEHEHKKYLRSNDSQYLKTIKGIHNGKRCFIIGNGPSLCASDLDKIKGEYSFAANRVFKIFDQTTWRPTYYLSTDRLVLRSIWKELNNYDLGHMFLALDKQVKLNGPTNKLTRIYYNTLSFPVHFNRWNDQTSYISEDVSNHFAIGHTVTFNAIQLAIYMGFKELYLLGVDHNYSIVRDANGIVHEDQSVQDYFDKKRYSERTDFSYFNVQYAYEIAKEYADTHDIKIYNATRGGKLEVFERVDFDSLVWPNM